MTMRRVLVILSSLAIAGCGSGIGQPTAADEWSRIVTDCREVGTEADLWRLRNTVRETRSYGYSRDEVAGVAYNGCNQGCWDYRCIATCSDCVRAIVDLEY
ncbi:MAG: hypothetical protein HYT46_00190 [Candidatus Vogelbacteria bacterium]|nr:hypothetical protein [Candidatus Vogelbacteria bacterium]